MSARSALIAGVLRANPGRTRLMVAAVAVGVGAVGSILGAYTVIDRTMIDSFASTHPAAATITVAGDALAAEQAASAVPGVTGAEARREVTVRMASADGWQPLTLVAVDDFASWDIGVAFPESGEWPPNDGQIVIERASLGEVALGVGDTITAASPAGSADLKVVGLAQDAGRTPAWMTGQVIGFVTPETLEAIGVGGGLDTLAVTTDAALDRDANRAIADAVASSLREAGFDVMAITVPEPGEHPAAGVMRTLLYLLQAFGAISFVAAIALVATLVVAEVKRSTGAIAVMKTGGATSAQVTGVYLTALAMVAGAGLAGGIVVALAGTWGLSTFAFGRLNIDATSFVPSWWVIPAQALVALAVPLAAVAIPVRRLSKVPVRESLAMGAAAPARAPRRTVVEPRWGRAASMGARNAFRQPGRLALTATSLAVGAAAVMTSLNTGAAWDRLVNAELSAQDFDIQATLTQPVATGSLDDAASQAGLARIEYWNVAQATVTGPGGHAGDVALVFSAPPDSTSAAFPLIEGRLLEPGDDHAVVVSQALKDPAVAVGDELTLEGDAATWHVVGVVRQLTGGEDGSVWASEPLDSMDAGSANVVRVSGPSEAEALTAIEQVASDAGVDIARAVAATDARQSLDDHLYIITSLLLVMSLGLSVVGLLGLVEAMSTAVAERRGEMGIAKTVGAASPAIIRMVIVEALTVVALAVVTGVALAVPLTAIVETAVGDIFVGAALPLTWWLPGVAIAAAVMAAAAAAASVVPAYEAADLPVREAFARA